MKRDPDDRDPVLSPDDQRWAPLVLAILVLAGMIVASLPPCEREAPPPPEPPPATSTGPWVLPLPAEPSPAPMSSRSEDPSPNRQARVDSLAAALLERMMLPNGRHAVVHCRRAPGGCDARCARFAEYFVDAAIDHELEPELLAAIAVVESGLAPEAVSRVGAAGIMQLHPAGVGRTVPFVRSVRIRTRCLDEPGACQLVVVDVGAMHLSRWLTSCGEVDRALGGYASGRCAGAPAYSRRVLRELERLRSSG